MSKVPSRFTEQTTSAPPDSIGSKYSADVVQRELQKILVIREYVSSYSDAAFVSAETGDILREAIVNLLSRVRSSAGLPVTVKSGSR